MNGCLLKVKEAVDNLRPSEKKVANYILDFPQESLGLSIGDLADRSGASKAAVIRFCKTLRFDGYREFSIKLAYDISSNNIEEDVYTDIQVGDNLKTIIKNVSHNNKKSITDSLLVLDFKELEINLEVIKAVGPRGHFLRQKHTRDHMRDFHYSPIFHQMDADGKSRDPQEMALEEFNNIYENHKPEPLPENVLKELDQILALADKIKTSLER